MPLAECQTVPRAAYLHLPFCRRRCHYCDFAIIPIGNLTTGSVALSRIEHYVHLLEREVLATFALQGACAGEGSPGLSSCSGASGGRTTPHPLTSVFFGGGTPSLLPPALLARILGLLRRTFGVAPGSEVSMEVDPGTFDACTLGGFLEAGVTRLSLGAQAFQERLLRACGRAHTVADVHHALETIRLSGIRNWSLDLISSLPFQTMEDWNHSLDAAIAHGAPHVSVYDLQIEDGTPFARWYATGEHPLPQDNVSADMYREASRKLQAAGYHHYEISNYARHGFECRHNLVYWRNEPYWGFGLGAASHVDGVRWTRPRKLEEYSLWVEDLEQRARVELAERKQVLQGTAPDRSGGQMQGQGGFLRGEVGGAQLMAGKINGWATDVGTIGQPLGQGHDEEKLLEFLMLGLRLSSGIDMTMLVEKFGAEVAEKLLSCLQQYVRPGLVESVSGGSLCKVVGGSPRDGPAAEALPPAADRDPVVRGQGGGLHPQMVYGMPEAHSEALPGDEELVVCALGGKLGAGVASLDGQRVRAPELEVELRTLLQGSLRNGGSLRIRLTDPEGFLVSNRIIAALFAEIGSA